MAIGVHDLTPLLQVFDMRTSIRFYCDLLGFELINQSQPGDDFDWAALALHGVKLMLNTAYDEGERPGTPDPARVAAHADTILYFNCPDPDGAYQHLRSAGLDPQPPTVAYYGMRQLYVSDPDGYALCFQCPT